MAKKAVKAGPKTREKFHRPSDKEDVDAQFFKRVMHRAYLRDGQTVYTGEALALAMLLHAKGKTNRSENEVNQVGKMLDDPNLRD